MSERRHFISGLAGVLIGAVLVAGAPAMATVGLAVIYGVTNTGDALTTLQGSANGPLVKIQNTGVTSDNALSLVSDGPNLVMSNGKKIVMLNADRVDSLSANQLVRAGHAESLNVVDGTGTKLTVNLTAPLDGILIAGGTIGAQYGTTADTYTCSIVVDALPIDGSIMNSRVDPTENTEEDCSTTGAINVNEGAHTITLDVGGADANTSLYGATLWVLFVPFDGSGAKLVVP
jgi:hypothetical protein